MKQLNTLWGDPRCEIYPNLSTPLGPVCTDSRKLIKGCFFVPLIGNNFNGHEFLHQAFHCGAQAALVSKEFKNKVPPDLLHWLVDDTLQAYQQLALLHRIELSIPVVAITGSVGKTTTRELVKGVISSLGNISSSLENNNNDIGVPLTLLNTNETHDAIVVEMGMRGLGEIQRLSCCSNPDIAVITNIGTAHLGLLGSRRNIALAKCEITSCLKSSGTVIIPSYDQLLEEVLTECWNGRVVRVAISERSADDHNFHEDSFYTDFGVDSFGLVDLQKGLLEVEGHTFMLPLEGRHNAMNFMLALAVAKELGVGLDEINKFDVKDFIGRNCSVSYGGILFLDETYNSSPESVRAALELLVSKPGRHFAVLGTMLELGSQSVQLHHEIGEYLTDLSIEGLVIVSTGEEGKAMAKGAENLPFLKIVSSPQEAVALLGKWLQPGDVVMLKASRAIGLERLLPLLKNKFNNSTF